MKAAAKKKSAKSKSHSDGATGKNIADTYNAFKLYQGRQYTGMAIGRSHKWHYDPGTWIDKKITPEKWLISFEVKKRRAGKAPEGSGVPVGTEYHWYILAHQMVKKLDANTYSTDMNGIKLKLAHKRSDKDKWNISDKTQRDHLVKMLKEYVRELENMELEEFIAAEQNITQKPKKAIKPMAAPVKKMPAKKAGSTRKRPQMAKA
jgi:hypothetical protein